MAIGATVLGGFTNTASGTYSTAAGHTNTASNTYSTAFGTGCTAGGAGSVAMGYQHTVSATGTQGDYGAIGGGFQNLLGTTASGRFGAIPGGRNCEVQAEYGVAHGYHARARLFGMRAQASGRFAATADAQGGDLVLRRQTADATPVALLLDGATASFKVALQNDSALAFHGLVVARNAGADQAAGYLISGLARRGANAASTVLVGTPTVTVLGEDDAAWDVTIAADTTHGAIDILVTGAAATTIHWEAYVRVAEVVG
jgi:hypothetical protein